MTFSWLLGFWNIIQIQGQRDVIFNNILYLTWKFWVSVGLIASKRDRQMRCSNNTEWLDIAFLWTMFIFSFWGCLSQGRRNAFSLWDHRNASEAQRPNAQTGTPLMRKLLSPSLLGDIMLIFSTMSFFSPFVLLKSAWKEVLSMVGLWYSLMACWATGKNGLLDNSFLFLRDWFSPWIES